MVHRNAPLSETGRLRLARCVVDDGGRCGEPPSGSRSRRRRRPRWAGRYRAVGAAGWPIAARVRTAAHVRRRRAPSGASSKSGCMRRWGPARIGYLLGLHPSTVHRVLTRYGLAKLRWLDRPTGRVIRRMELAALRGPGPRRRQEARQDPRRRRLAHAGPHRWATATREPTRVSGVKASTATRCTATTSCTPPSTTTPGWPTPNC